MRENKRARQMIGIIEQRRKRDDPDRREQHRGQNQHASQYEKQCARKPSAPAWLPLRPCLAPTGSNPNQRQQAQRRQPEHQDQALPACLGIGEHQRDKRLGKIIAGRRDDDSRHGEAHGSHFPRGLRESHDERVHRSKAGNHGHPVNSSAAQMDQREIGRHQHYKKHQPQQKCGTQFQRIFCRIRRFRSRAGHIG